MWIHEIKTPIASSKLVIENNYNNDIVRKIDGKYIYDKKDPCYAYITGRDNKGIHDVKLYFPKRNKHYTKFITNYNHLEGIYNLERDDYDYINSGRGSNTITFTSKDGDNFTKKEQGTYFYIHCSLYNPYLNDIGRKPASFFCRLKCDT